MQQKGDTFREDLPLNVKNGMKVLKNKTIYTGTEKIENGYIRYSERISEVDDMRNFIPKDEDEIVEVDGAYVIPGFIDGCFPGRDRPDGTSDDGKRGDHFVFLYDDDTDI